MLYFRSGPPGFNYHNLQVAAIDAFSSVSPYHSVSQASYRNIKPQTIVIITQCTSHGYFIDGSCVCFPRFTGVQCETETAWADYYAGSVLSFTSNGASRLLCIRSDKKSNTATTCLDDDLMSQSYFEIKTINSSSVYIKSSSVADTYLVSSGPGCAISAVYLPTNDALLQTPAAVFTVEIYYEELSSFEVVEFRTLFGGYLSVSTGESPLHLIDATGGVTDYSKYTANEPQQCS